MSSRKSVLTADDQRRIPEYRERWQNIGFSTRPAEREAAEEAIRFLYWQIRLESPRIVWCDSPFSLMLSAALVLSPMWYWQWFRTCGRRVPMRDRVAPSVREAAERAFECSVAAARADGTYHPNSGCSDWKPWLSVGREIRRSLALAWDNPGFGLADPPVVDAARRAMGLDEPFRNAVGSLRSASEGVFLDHVPRGLLCGPLDGGHNIEWWRHRDEVLLGQYDADWIGLHEYLVDICDARSDGIASSGFGLLCRSAGWALPRARVCWVCERPTSLQRDEAGRLHSADGPAVSYPDGWEPYSWHGVRVEEEWIRNPESLDPESILGQPNLELRQAMADIAGGWDVVLARAGARPIDRDDDPLIGTLLEVDTRGQRARFLEVLCGTGRRFLLHVPPECRTAREANAWTYGLPADQYAPELRT